MERRHKKQFLIIVLVAIAALSIVGASFGRRFREIIYPIPSPAPKESLLDLIWVKAFPGEGDDSVPYSYDVAARVRNQSADKGVRQFRYRIELAGAGGEVLGERVGSSYLRRGSVKYIVENSVASALAPSRVRFFVTGVDPVDDAESEVSPVILRQKDFREGRLSGVALNRSVLGFQRIDIGAVLFDAENRPVRARATTLTHFLPNEERAFEMRWQNAGTAASDEVEISTNIFDPDNYLPEERKDVER